MRNDGCVAQIDKPGSDVDAVKTALMNHDVLLEEFGGDTQCALVSGRTGEGVDQLLELIMLQAEVMGLRSALSGPAEGVALEARVDKRLGVVVSAIVQRGVLRVGDLVLSGGAYGRVKRIMTDSKTDVQEVPPAIPIQVLIFAGWICCLFIVHSLCRSLGSTSCPTRGKSSRSWTTRRRPGRWPRPGCA